jgi:hypothetical protein
MAEQSRHENPSDRERAGSPPGSTGDSSTERGRPSGTSVHHRDSTQSSAYEPGHVGGRQVAQPVTDDVSGWRNFGRRVSWGAIFAGVVIAMAVQILLTVLGVGAGAAVVEAAERVDPAAWTVGVGLWWVITGLIALFIGGWVAGHLSTNPDRIDGALHGLATWGLVAVIGVWLAGTTLGTVTAGAWQAVATNNTAQQQDIMAPRQQQLDVPNMQQNEITEQLRRAAEEGDEAAHAGFWGFAALLLGAVAAAFGGFLATPSNAATNINTTLGSRQHRHGKRL